MATHKKQTDISIKGRIFSILADRTRLSILSELEKEAGTVSEIQERLGIEQSLASHQLRTLRESGFVEKNGRKFEINGKIMPLLEAAERVADKLSGKLISKEPETWLAMEPRDAIGHEDEIILGKAIELKKSSSRKKVPLKKIGEISNFFNNDLEEHFRTEENGIFKTMGKEAGRLASDHNLLRGKFRELEKLLDGFGRGEGKKRNRLLKTKSGRHFRLQEISGEILKLLDEHVRREQAAMKELG